MYDAPHVATRDCEHCQLFVYDADGKPQIYRGGLVLRPKGNLPNCRTPAGCPKGTPENQKGLTDQNMHALAHYRECVAVGYRPDEAADPIVRRNAAIISRMEARQERQRWSEFRTNILTTMIAGHR